MAAQNEIGGRFTIDIEDLKNGITQANRLMRLADSEFKAAAAGLGNWADSAEGLTAKQKQLNTAMDLQNAKIEALEQEYTRVAAAQGENSAAAQNLRIRINNETAAREKNRAELEKVSSALEELEKDAEGAADAADELADKEKKAADAADDAGDSSESFGARAAAAAKGGVAALATAATGLVTAFLASAEATREYRTEMGKLEAAYTTAGHSAETAKKTYGELYAVMGDEGAAVEAANHLAQLVDNEKDLATWTNIAAGVNARWSSSLPIESLAEAANETARSGALTGGLTDALVWAGVAEEDFQKKLDGTTTQQERQELITSTLNGLYKDYAAGLKETNGDIMAARDAQTKLNDSMAKVGEMAEPVMTKLKTMGAEALNAFTNLFDGFNEMMAGDMSIGDFGGQVLDRIVQAFTTGAPKLAAAGLQAIQSLAAGIQGNTSGLIESALAMLETITGKIRDGAPDFIKSGLEVIQNLIKGIMDSLPDLIAKVPVIVSNIAGVINDNAPTILKSAVNIIWTIIKGLISAIPDLVANIPKIIKAIVDVWLAFNWANLGKSAITSLGNGIKGLISWVKGIGSSVSTNIVNAVKGLPASLKTLGTNAINNMGSAISGAKSTVTKAAKEIYNAAVNAVKGLPDKMLSIGKDLVKGLWNGISNMTSWVINKIQGFSGDVLGGIKNFFGIESPSKVMRDVVGKNLVRGITAGIESESGDLYTTMRNVVDNTTAAAQPGLAGNAGQVAAGTVINFTQNNPSPKALSAYEVARQTRIAGRMMLGGRY